MTKSTFSINRRRALGGAVLVVAPAAAGAGQMREDRAADLPEHQVVVGLFVSIPTTDIPDGVTIISTIGWSVPGYGTARYVADPMVDAAFVKIHPMTAAVSRNGRGFRLAEEALSIAMTGASPKQADNSRSLQQAINEISAAGGGQVNIPSGKFRFRTGLTMMSGVDIVGQGKAGSVLLYEGSGTAINAVGTPDTRKIFQLRDLSINSASIETPATGIELAWNQRSLPLMERVGIAGFGRYGIAFVGNNWLLTFRDVEIHDCGRAVKGGAGIHRHPNAKGFDALADIKFFGLVVEACGHPRSAGGAITFHCNAPFATQGLWFHGCCVEGNFGLADLSFENVDMLSIDQSYFEVTVIPEQSRDGIHVISCQLTFTNCRCGSDVGNKSGTMLVACGNSALNMLGNSWDSDFGSADVRISTETSVTSMDFTRLNVSPMRVKPLREIK